jgi:DnaJ-domain-containing protein 1
LPSLVAAPQDGGVPSTAVSDLRRALGRGELVRVLYRLGRESASGMLTLNARPVAAGPNGQAAGAAAPTPPARPDVLVLRRGAAVCSGELARGGLVARLTRLAGEASIAAAFDAGVTAYPPGALHQLGLASWARGHLEAQLDGARAEALVRELGPTRLRVRPELAPEPLDEADRRMLAALAVPRSLAEVWPLARAPKFRLLALVHFLRAVDAVEIEPASRPAPRPAAARPAPLPYRDPRRTAALDVLGLDAGANADGIKRAYRRLARTLHPDLQPDADAPRRRALERRFAELTAAYDALNDALNDALP